MLEDEPIDTPEDGIDIIDIVVDVDESRYGSHEPVPIKEIVEKVVAGLKCGEEISDKGPTYMSPEQRFAVLRNISNGTGSSSYMVKGQMISIKRRDDDGNFEITIGAIHCVVTADGHFSPLYNRHLKPDAFIAANEELDLILSALQAQQTKQEGHA